MKKIVLSLITCASHIALNAQVPNHHWTFGLNGGSSAKGYCIAADKFGNVYTSGVYGSTSDFDPGTSVSNLTSNGDLDIFLLKTDASGNFVWAKSFGGTGTDIPKEIAIDTAGNIHLTGIFEGTADFDPGVGISNLISVGGSDAFVAKVNSNGQLSWAKSFGGSGNDNSNAIDIDDYDGAVYVFGDFTGTVDFDPSITVNNATSIGSSDIFLTKFTQSGVYSLTRTFGSVSADRGNDITVDATTGDQFMTGHFGGVADFDPGAAQVNLSGSNDVFVLKYDVNSDFVFAKKMGGIAVDEGRNIAIDPNGFIYVNGSFISTGDFDPDAGVVNITSNGSDDVFVTKLTPSGGLIWVKTFGSIGTEDFMDMSVTSFGKIYLTGEMGDNMDANPDAVITFPLTIIGAEDAYIISLNNDGSFDWATSYGGTSLGTYTRGAGVFADENDNVYVTGSFQNTVDFNPSAVVLNLTASAGSDIFIQKLGPGFNALSSIETENFEIVPNPNNGKFVLQGIDVQGINLKILDVSGKIIFEQKSTSNNTEFDLSYLLNSGIYFIRLEDTNASKTLRFIKN
jgi:Secretion system C-terminal sorting domain